MLLAPLRTAEVDMRWWVTYCPMENKECGKKPIFNCNSKPKIIIINWVSKFSPVYIHNCNHSICWWVDVKSLTTIFYHYIFPGFRFPQFVWKNLPSLSSSMHSKTNSNLNCWLNGDELSRTVTLVNWTLAILWNKEKYKKGPLDWWLR